MQRPQLIIFTDLDGTLLDHHSYSWEEARPALEQLRQRRVPLILTTSKTAAEVDELRQALQLDTPTIIENGAGIILPAKDGDSAHFFSRSYAELVNLMQQLRRDKGYRFSGFSDFSVAEVMAETGLGERQARLAKDRLCSEPLRWEDSAAALEAFRQDLQHQELQLLRGGRFYHLLGRQADKGRAARWLLAHYRKQQPGDYFSVGLGDGPNDQELLEAVDLAVIIPSASGLSPQPQGVRILLADAPGPAGWNRAILQILNEIDPQGVFHG